MHSAMFQVCHRFVVSKLHSRHACHVTPAPQHPHYMGPQHAIRHHVARHLVHPLMSRRPGPMVLWWLCIFWQPSLGEPPMVARYCYYRSLMIFSKIREASIGIIGVHRKMLNYHHPRQEGCHPSAYSMMIRMFVTSATSLGYRL